MVTATATSCISTTALPEGGGKDASGKKERSLKRERRRSRVRGDDQLEASLSPQIFQTPSVTSNEGPSKLALWAIDVISTQPSSSVRRDIREMLGSLLNISSELEHGVFTVTFLSCHI